MICIVGSWIPKNKGSRMSCVFVYFRYYYFAREGNQQRFKNQGGRRRGLGPRNDFLTTCKAVNPRASQRPSKAAVCFLTISTLALSFE